MSIFTIRLSHQNNPRDLQVSVTASRGRGEPTKWQLVQRVCEMKLSAEERNNFTNNRLINVDFAHPGCSVTWCIRTTILTLFFFPCKPSSHQGFRCHSKDWVVFRPLLSHLACKVSHVWHPRLFINTWGRRTSVSCLSFIHSAVTHTQY